MKNAVQPTRVITMTADRDYKSGDFTKIQSMVGVNAYDVKQGEEMELSTIGGYEVKADPALTGVVGEQLDIDVANMQAVPVGTGDATVGAILWKDKLNGSETVNIRLDGISVA